VILKGWKIERTSVVGLSVFEPITITAPNGFSTVVYKHERNPANILWMLADDLLKARNDGKE
jgi:hypothetical protein